MFDCVRACYEVQRPLIQLISQQTADIYVIDLSLQVIQQMYFLIKLNRKKVTQAYFHPLSRSLLIEASVHILTGYT